MVAMLRAALGRIVTGAAAAGTAAAASSTSDVHAHARPVRMPPTNMVSQLLESCVPLRWGLILPFSDLRAVLDSWRENQRRKAPLVPSSIHLLEKTKSGTVSAVAFERPGCNRKVAQMHRDLELLACPVVLLYGAPRSCLH